MDWMRLALAIRDVGLIAVGVLLIFAVIFGVLELGTLLIGWIAAPITILVSVFCFFVLLLYFERGGDR